MGCEMKLERKKNGEKKLYRPCLKCACRVAKESIKKRLKADPSLDDRGIMPGGCLYTASEIIKIWEADDKKKKNK